MPIFNYRETLHYFGDKLRATPPEEDVVAGEVELYIDQLRVLIAKGSIEGELSFTMTLGLLLHPIPEPRLKELATCNFLGINTGGCTLAFDEGGMGVELSANISPGTPPQESWEYLHRLLHVATEWNKTLTLWEEFVPLTVHQKEKDVPPAHRLFPKA